MITSSNQYRNLRVVFGHSNSTKVGKSEVGSRKSEVGSRKSEVESRQSKFGSPSSAFVNFIVQCRVSLVDQEKLQRTKPPKYVWLKLSVLKSKSFGFLHFQNHSRNRTLFFLLLLFIPSVPFFSLNLLIYRALFYNLVSATSL